MDFRFWHYPQRIRQRTLGTIVAIGLTWLALVGVSKKSSVPIGRLIVDLFHYGLSVERRFEVANSQSLELREGDPVLGYHDGKWVLLGNVASSGSVGSPSNGPQIEVVWQDYQFGPIKDLPWLYCETPTSFAWVAQALLPEEKRNKLAVSLKSHFQRHREDLLQNLEPLVVQSLQDLVPQIEERLKVSLRSRQPEIEALGLRYQSELIQQKLLPLIKTEIIPIMQSKSKPLLNTIGAELFEKASVWRFTWRYLYDVSPLPQRDLVQSEFNRFVEKDAMPILESHTEEILSTMKSIALEIGKNEAVRQTGRDVALEVFHDPEFRMILAVVLQEAFADTQGLQKTLRNNWEGEVGRKFAASLESFIDPWLREMGAELIGGPESGLTPEFVAVLRSQVLSKDQRWIEVPIQSMQQQNLESSQPGYKSTFQLIRSTRLPLYPKLAESP